MIDSKHLRLILAIDELGSLSKAAVELNLTQSALSHQLKNLEDYLGIKAFNRVGNQLHFTEAGKEIRDKAKLILGEMAHLEARIQEIKESQVERYIHGYSLQEYQRLADQAQTVSDYLHYDSIWEEGSTILEIGCGVGAQTEIIAAKNPGSRFISIDISEDSLAIARSKIEEKGLSNIEFRWQDVRDISASKSEKFDHIFICFLLEHLHQPLSVLKQLKNIIKPGGTITIIEGDHGSTFFYPENAYAEKVVNAQVELQKKKGGNANIGRQLFPLLNKTGYQEIEVSPRQIYVDSSKPALVKGFIENTFTAMIQGISEDIIAERILPVYEVQKGIKGLLDTAKPNGVFSYTFFKGRARV